MGHKVAKGKTGYSIQLIGAGGAVLEEIRGTKATFSVPSDSGYVRAKVIYTREADTGYENFYAWMQPVFMDGRSHFVNEN